MGQFYNFYSAGSFVDAGSSRAWFAGQHTNQRRNARRAAIKAAGGIRQYKRRQRAVRELNL